jgi:hypothetical protein
MRYKKVEPWHETHSEERFPTGDGGGAGRVEMEGRRTSDIAPGLSIHPLSLRDFLLSTDLTIAHRPPPHRHPAATAAAAASLCGGGGGGRSKLGQARIFFEATFGYGKRTNDTGQIVKFKVQLSSNPE